MKDAVFAKSINSSTVEVVRGEAMRMPNIKTELPGGMGELRHVGGISVGLMAGYDEERPIMVTLTDTEHLIGLYVLLHPAEARSIGEKLVKLSQPEYRSEKLTEMEVANGQG